MLFMSIVPIILTIVPVMIYQIVMLLCKRKSTSAHYVWTYILMIYIWLVISVTGIGSIWDIISKGGLVASFQQANVSFIPFQSEGIFTYCMNVIMLLPLGFLLPYIWKNFRTPFKVSLTGFLFSAFIEFTQLPTNRLADIDDLIMNTLGAILGYIIWKMIGKYFFNKKEEKRTISLGKYEPAIYISLACICNFLLYNWTWFLTNA
ncbi:MAG: VanZ family protein [Lachnospiraceae bacterium]